MTHDAWPFGSKFQDSFRIEVNSDGQICPQAQHGAAMASVIVPFECPFTKRISRLAMFHCWRE
jgi:hypothetical protein